MVPMRVAGTQRVLTPIRNSTQLLCIDHCKLTVLRCPHYITRQSRWLCASLPDTHGQATTSSSAASAARAVNVYEQVEEEAVVPKNLVIAVDRTSDAREAVQWALQHVAAPGDTVHLLNVVTDTRSPETTVGASSAGAQWDPSRLDYLARKSWISKLEKEAHAMVKQQFVPLCQGADVHVEVDIVVAKGHKSAAGIGQAICDKADMLHASLLFIASHGTGVLADYGSVAKYCSDHSRAPVLMLPPAVGKLQNSSPGQLLVVGLGDLRGLESALAFTARNLLKSDDQVQVVFMRAGGAMTQAEVERTAQKALGKQAAQCSVQVSESASADTQMDSQFAQDVCNRADSLQARAVVLLHHGQGMAQEMIFGSITSYFTRNCMRPLVVFRS